MYTGGGAALRFSALRAGDRRDAINSLRAGELPSMLRGSERRQVGQARRKVFDLKKKKIDAGSCLCPAVNNEEELRCP